MDEAPKFTPVARMRARARLCAHVRLIKRTIHPSSFPYTSYISGLCGWMDGWMEGGWIDRPIQLALEKFKRFALAVSHGLEGF